jgi:lipopolysaccharide/colanic/teichoic acid biosynthesis glycosyltransferase
VPACSAATLSATSATLKRSFDLLVAGTGLVLCCWLIGLGWIVARLDTGQGFFRQERVGRAGKLFRIVKLCTMRSHPGITTTTTVAGDPRITNIGRVLRAMKLDELPQLYNVLVGDMSIVGPRPDVPGYADALTGGDRIILSVRPGITGPATLRFRHEERLLRVHPDPERYNREVLFPEKVRINRAYVENYSFGDDLRYVAATILPWLTVPPR